MTLQIWTITTSAGDLELEPDPEQVVYPQLRGHDGGLEKLATDGQVKQYGINGIEIKGYEPGEGFVDVVAIPGKAARLYVTDRRVVVTMTDVDLGPSGLMTAADFVIPGMGGLRDITRMITKSVRTRYHFVAQIDYQCLTLVRYYQATGILQRSLLQLGSAVGEPPPVETMGIWTSLSQREKVSEIAEDILRRAIRAQLARTVLPVTEEQKVASSVSRFAPSGADGRARIAILPGPVTLTDYKRA
ncbi:MAG: hypothetical protein JWP48_6794 [Actinoallomurus sp.]|jgi:hypothetical protein|nr:hypothetical protein [Actinoallomurus sp.]